MGNALIAPLFRASHHVPISTSWAVEPERRYSSDKTEIPLCLSDKKEIASNRKVPFSSTRCRLRYADQEGATQTPSQGFARVSMVRSLVWCLHPPVENRRDDSSHLLVPRSVHRRSFRMAFIDALTQESSYIRRRIFCTTPGLPTMVQGLSTPGPTRKDSQLPENVCF